MSSLLEEEQRNSCKISTTPPERNADTYVSSNSSQAVCPEIRSCCLSWKNYKYSTITYHFRYQLTLVLLELRVIFVPTQCLTSVIGFLQTLKLRFWFWRVLILLPFSENFTDFTDFCRRMRTNWFFRNKPTPKFSEVPTFSPKSSWKLPKGHPNLVVF